MITFWTPCISNDIYLILEEKVIWQSMVFFPQHVKHAKISHWNIDLITFQNVILMYFWNWLLFVNYDTFTFGLQFSNVIHVAKVKLLETISVSGKCVQINVLRVFNKIIIAQNDVRKTLLQWQILTSKVIRWPGTSLLSREFSNAALQHSCDAQYKSRLLKDSSAANVIS